MTETPILPPITFQQGKHWLRLKTVTEAIDGIGKMLKALEDESLERQQLLSWRGALREYDDTPARCLPDDDRARLVDVLDHFGTVHEKPAAGGE